MGLVKPKRSIERAICLICFLEWIRAFPALGPQALRRDVFDVQITHNATLPTIARPIYIYRYLINIAMRRDGVCSRMLNAPAVARLTLDVNIYGVRADTKLRC